jgi:AraC family transcriptional activator of pobA
MESNQILVFESLYKTLGLQYINQLTPEDIYADKYKPYIKVLYLPPGYTLIVDFKQYSTETPSLFFLNSNQYWSIQETGEKEGYMICYNRDFYCVQIHDAEVACDGLLFNNLHNMPMTRLDAGEAIIVDGIFKSIKSELKEPQSQQEEMLRVYLKQLIIYATRLWSAQQLGRPNHPADQDSGFFRQFSMLVEKHYKEKHTVADYAEIMGMAPKTLTHKLKKMNLCQPGEIIKDRIILEAKRLLIHTFLSAKQIAYHLGYNDPAYFSRLFALKAGDSTLAFRKKYNQGKMYN